MSRLKQKEKLDAIGCLRVLLSTPFLAIALVFGGGGIYEWATDGIGGGAIASMAFGFLAFVAAIAICGGGGSKKQIPATREQLATIRALRGVVPPDRRITAKAADVFIEHLRQIRWNCSSCGEPVFDGERLRRRCSRCKAELHDCFADIREIIR